MKLIERKNSLQHLINVMNVPGIKLIAGIHSSGKSKLMDSFIDYLHEHNQNSNIIRINLNCNEFEPLESGDLLYEYVDQHYDSTEENFLFIDEIQLCKDFELPIISLHEEERFNIFLRGRKI